MPRRILQPPITIPSVDECKHPTAAHHASYTSDSDDDDDGSSYELTVDQNGFTVLADDEVERHYVKQSSTNVVSATTKPDDVEVIDLTASAASPAPPHESKLDIQSSVSRPSALHVQSSTPSHITSIQHQHSPTKRQRNNTPHPPVTLTDITSQYSDIPIDCYCVIDYEASCNKRDAYFKNEIIEWPAVLISAYPPYSTISTFHSYVKPVMQSQLTEFCIKLTGITQEQVDKAPPLNCVIQRFEQWCEQQRLHFPTPAKPTGPEQHADSHSASDQKLLNCCLVTDGPYDFVNFLTNNCRFYSLPYPSYAHYYLDIRRYYTLTLHTKARTLRSMLAEVHLQFEGQEHCGMDDAKNITRLLIYFLQLNNGKAIKPNAHVIT